MHDQLGIPDGQDGFVMELHDSAGLSELHWHEELEFNLITAGTAYYVVGSRRLLVSAGTLIWFFPRQEHLLVDYSNSFCMWVTVFTDPVRSRLAERDECELLLNDDPGRLLTRKLALEDHERLNELCDVVCTTTGNPERFNLGIAFLVAEAWHAFLHGNALQSGTDLSRVVAGALRLISRAGGCLPLTDAAAQLNSTTSWLSRSFHREMGMTYTSYCNRTRLIRFHALRRANPGTPLTQLAYGAGFGSYAQFYRVYREAHGAPPAAVREHGS